MADSRQDRALTNRWTDDLAGLVVPIRSWLVGGGPKPAGLSVTDGRIDLRGVPLAASSRVVSVGSPTVAARESPAPWEGLDLSGAHLDHVAFFGAVLRDCVFDRADLQVANFWGCDVEECSFVGADLRSAAFGTGNPVHGVTRWERVDFSKAKLTKAHAEGAELSACRFENLAGVVFQDCDFTRVAVHGRVRRVVVDSRGLRFPENPRRLGLDLSHASLDDFTIEGGDSATVVTPADGSLWVVESYRDRLAEVASRFAASADPADQGMVRFAQMYASRPGAEGGQSDLCLSWPPVRSVAEPTRRLREVLERA